jgi:alpha-galactosidase
MLEQNEEYFLLSTDKTSLLLHVNEVKKLVVEYYGRRIHSLEEASSLTRTYPYNQGCSTAYDKEFVNLSLDHMKLAVSTLGKSDFFAPSIILNSEESSIFDFTFRAIEKREVQPFELLPFPHGGNEEVILHLEEKAMHVLLDLHYILFEKENVIAQYSEIINQGDSQISINKIASLQLPLVNNKEFELWSTYGNWAGELQIQKQPLTSGRFVLESLRGSSSHRHNPFFLLKEKEGSYQHGSCYGFNLMYSSNFENSIEMDSFGDIRVQVGISSTLFSKKLNRDENFITPVAVMSYSKDGINDLSSNFHDFVNEHVIPERWKNTPRPVAYNNWEATFMKFNKGKIISLMKKAASLGVELFVLDDGWFSTRNDDSHGLGDWDVNEKKLPGGLDRLAQEANKLGMKFGIWMEPEMVNADTKTYHDHPDWVIHDKFHKPSIGRYQYVLDLRNKEVQDFVYDVVSQTLKSGNISYLKWDYNRDISDFDNRDGTFFYDYITGLYAVIRRLVKDFPDVLFENCASGGNRFDLGMLNFFAQSWMSDDTDCYQRCLIQEGGLLGYPLSVMSNHVAAKTSNQMLRYTPFDTKFDTAAFGVLGYELDLLDLSKRDCDIVAKQIQFYKDHRMTFQWGKVYQDRSYIDSERKMMEALGEKEALVSIYSKIQKPNPMEERLRCFGLEEESLYQYETRKESIPLRRFGNLINYVLPFHLNPEGTLISAVSRYRDMTTEQEKGVASGGVLGDIGCVLAQEWSGVGYDDRVRLMGDFGARLYLIEKK